MGLPCTTTRGLSLRDPSCAGSSATGRACGARSAGVSRRPSASTRRTGAMVLSRSYTCVPSPTTTIVRPRRLYRRRGLTIVVVGDGTQVYDRLKTIAPVRLVDADGRRLTPADLAPQARPVALDPAQLGSRSDSPRVVVQGNPIGATVSAVRRTADSLVYTERSVLGGVFEQLTTIVFDPAAASVKSVAPTVTQEGKKAEKHPTYGDGWGKGQ